MNNEDRPDTVGDRLRRAAEIMRERGPVPMPPPEDRLYVVGEDDDIPAGAVRVPLWGHSTGYGYILRNGRTIRFHSVENTLASGARDDSRSHDSINGRKVCRSRYRREVYR